MSGSRVNITNNVTCKMLYMLATRIYPETSDFLKCKSLKLLKTSQTHILIIIIGSIILHEECAARHKDCDVFD